MTQKWEYLWETDTGFAKTKVDGVKYESPLDYLNQRGKEGWELVCMTTGSNSYVFKRLITN
jgi:hypothetical protein